MSDTDTKEILETIYGETVPEGAVSLVQEARRRLTAFGPCDLSLKDIALMTMMFDLYIKAKNSPKRGRPAKESEGNG